MLGTNLNSKPFDVIFTGGKGDYSCLLSILVQRVGDRKARYAARGFSHVSIVLDDSYALEAVPADDTPEKGIYSGAELSAGVRIIPLLDLVLPSQKYDVPIAVFRSQKAATISQSAFGLHSYAILQRFASQYSLEGLREAVEKNLNLIPAQITDLLRKRFVWTSPRQNIAALLVDEELRLSLEKNIPGYKFPFIDGKYFCSKLVAELLEEMELAHFNSSPEKISPTGLYAHLLELSAWTDVADSDYGPDGIKKAAKVSSPSICKDKYSFLMSEIALKLQNMGIASVTDLIATGRKKVEDDLKDVEDLMQKLGWADSRRQAARSRESDLVDAFVAQAAIADAQEREKFRSIARDLTRMFGLGALDYETFKKAVAEAIPKKA